MRDMEFAKIIRIKRKYLYWEIKYKTELQELEKGYSHQLIKIKELIENRHSEDIEIGVSLLELKDSINWNLQGIISDIHYSEQRIKYIGKYSKITIPLG